MHSTIIPSRLRHFTPALCRTGNARRAEQLIRPRVRRTGYGRTVSGAKAVTGSAAIPYPGATASCGAYAGCAASVDCIGATLGTPDCSWMISLQSCGSASAKPSCPLTWSQISTNCARDTRPGEAMQGPALTTSTCREHSADSGRRLAGKQFKEQSCRAGRHGEAMVHMTRTSFMTLLGKTLSCGPVDVPVDVPPAGAARRAYVAVIGAWTY